MRFNKKYISDFLSPPIAYDEDGKRIIVSYLKTILIVAIVILPLFVVIKMTESGKLHPADYILSGLFFSFVILLILLNDRSVFIVSILFSASAWLGLTLMAVFADGVKDIAIVGYIVLIFVATLLSGIRFALVVTAISIISVWIMGMYQAQMGIMPEGDLPFNYSRDYTVLFIIVLTAIILFTKGYRYSYDRIIKELQERKLAEQKLSRNELILQEKNEELNRSNLRMITINEELLAAKEKAEESDRLKTAFIHNISHEIRTPMNGIVGFIELLRYPDTDSEKADEYIGIINSCTHQLASLVNDLLDISKLDAGVNELNLSSFEVNDILIEIDNIYIKAAREKGLSFTVNNEIGALLIRSDKGKIKQVINNLVSNSIKFTSNGAIAVNISRSENDLVVSVTDTGIGIPASKTELIFDRFHQADVSLNRQFGGTGLGLAISKGNVEFLGGRIWVESRPEIGSVFTFAIPVGFLTGKKTKKGAAETYQLPHRM